MNDMAHDNDCLVEDVAAYLDGELNPVEGRRFEAHVPGCARCSSELLNQRQLLCTLDAAFNDSLRFDLPQNFTRVVAAHAENNLRGVRSRKERRLALQLCALMALIAFALLGAASSRLVFQPTRNFAHLVTRVFDVFWHTAYDAAVGAAVILRMIGRATVVSPYGLGIFIAVVFLIAISLLPRLIANYHRAQIIE